MVLLKKIKSSLISKLQKKIKRTSRSIPSPIHQIGIWLLESDQNTHVETEIKNQLIDKTNNPSIQITFIYFSTKKRKKGDLFSENKIHTNDISYFFKIKNKKQLEILTNSYDILINLLPTLNVNTEYFLSKSKAKFIIGSGGKKMLPYHDFMVNSKSTESLNLFKEIIHYMYYIQSTKHVTGGK